MIEESKIRLDRMRFTKNTTSSRLALLAIVLNVLYFISIYKVNHTAYYTYWMGISIIYNLVFMLAAFLCSEGAKNYDSRYSKVMWILGILQFVRIAILPARMHETLVNEKIPLLETELDIFGYHIPAMMDNVVMPSGQYILVILYLTVSGICLIAAAIVNHRKSKALTAHVANLSLRQE